MKKFGIILFALMAMLSSCTEKKEVAPTDINVTANISMSQKENETIGRVSSDYGAANADEWAFSWEQGDPVYMVNHKSSNVAVGVMIQQSFSGATAKYTGSIDAEAANYSLIHADNVKLNGGATTMINSYTASVEISTEQDGDLNSLMMISDVNAVPSEIPADYSISPGLKHVGGFMILAVDFTNIPVYWLDVDLVKIEYSGVNTKCDIDLSKNVSDADFYSNFEQKTITVTPKQPIAVTADAYAQLYVNILPTEYTQLNATLYFSNGVRYEIVKTATETGQMFERGTFNGTALSCNLSNEASKRYKIGTTDYSSDNNSYVISTEEDLLALGALASSGKLAGDKDCIFSLTNDIKVNGEKRWAPIGYTDRKYFAGTFEGNGNTISGFNCEGIGSFGSYGLFGYALGENTVIKNLIVDDASVNIEIPGKHVAVIAGTLESLATMVNCGAGTGASASLKGRGAVGALAGRACGANIYNCYNLGSISGSNTETARSLNIGGLVGSAYYNSSIQEIPTTMSNCYNSGSVSFSGTGDIHSGGLIGMVKPLDYYSNLYFRNDGEGSHTEAYDTGYVPTVAPINVVGKSASVMKSTGFITTLNGIITSIPGAKTWKLGDDEYPVIAF